MKRMLYVFPLIVLLFVQLSIADDIRKIEDVNWDQFSENLVKAVKSNNEGVQAGALKNIIAYAGNLNVQDAQFDILRMYRDGNDQRLRQMAVVALHRMESKVGMYIMKRNLDLENNPVIQRQIADCIYKAQNESLADLEPVVAKLAMYLVR